MNTTGRECVMSLLSLSVTISYFNIDLKIKQNKEKKADRLRKRIEHELRLNQVLENRLNGEHIYGLNHIARY